MKPSTCLLFLFSGIAIAEGVDPRVPEDGFVKLEKRKGCSGNRLNTDRCKGNKMNAPFNSFHNCANAGGHCCALEKNGQYGLDVKKGIGREDCGYCFTGYCKS